MLEPSRRLVLADDDAVPAAGAFVVVAATAFANGGYFPTEWGWTLLALALAAVLAVLVRERVGLSGLEAAAAAALAGFAGWTLLSTAWSASAAQPVLAFERTLVYAAALLAALLLASARRHALALAAGLVAACVAVGGYGLATRLAPGWAGRYPPENGYQLQEPIGYWNGLGILAAIGALVALGLAYECRAPAARALAGAAAPPLAATLYFTFSRGSWVALGAGLCAAVAIAPGRLRLLGNAALLAPAPALAVWLASRSEALTHESATLSEARRAGALYAVALVACAAAGLLAGLALPSLERRLALRARARRAVGAVLLSLVGLVLVLGLVRVGGPSGVVDRARDSFNRSLPATGGDLNRRLVSLSSDGRADYWRVAATEIREHPWLGGGAGSYVRYWHRDRPTSYEAENAHNLYLETLAEVGPVGLALLLAALGLPLVGAVRARGRPGVTAATAGFAAYLVHAGVDWDFQILAVTLAALVCAAALLVAARTAEPRPLSGRARGAALAVLLPLAAVAVAIQVGASALASGRTSLDRGDPAAAVDAARRARRWQPWSYEPWQLQGEARLAADDAAAARGSLARALERDRSNWSLWYDLAQASRGAARERAIAEARRLNPRSAELDELAG